MILRIKGFDLEVRVGEDRTPVLIVLDKVVFRSVVSSIFDNMHGISNNDVVIEDENNQIIEYTKKVVCLDEFFNINFKSKEIITNLYKKIEDSINTDMEVKQKLEYDIKALGQAMYQLTDDIDMELSYNNQIAFTNILKLFNFQIDDANMTSSIEKLLSLINIYADFEIVELFIFINLKAFFDNREIAEIYKCLKYKKINFICIETQYCDRICEENIYLIDEDLVEISYSK